MEVGWEWNKEREWNLEKKRERKRERVRREDEDDKEKIRGWLREWEELQRREIMKAIENGGVRKRYFDQKKKKNKNMGVN